jgi:aminopeptidase
MVEFSMTFKPSDLVLERYARVLVNFALGSGQGIKKGETVFLQIPEVAKRMLVFLRREVLTVGGNPIVQYLPDDMAREFFELASDRQLRFFPKYYLRGRIREADHNIYIIAETDMEELKDIDPKKIMMRNKVFEPYKRWRDLKEDKGKFTWTLALFGTKAMAKEAELSEKEYWEQIIKACFLNKKDPIKKWRKVVAEIERIKGKLNGMQINRLKVEAEETDLVIKIGKNREWMGGRGRNIPSFEIFISPDWRGTLGKVSFNQPLYLYGNIVRGVKMEFKKGVLKNLTARAGQKLIGEMAKVENADKIGEFSLTDGRFSRIERFMANTLYDENMGGKYGNMHIALGSAYKDSYPGDGAAVSKEQWHEMGYNDSVVHTDVVSTSDRVVTAILADKSKKVIYKDGKFTV